MNQQLLHNDEFLRLNIPHELLFLVMNNIREIHFFAKNTKSQFIAANQFFHDNCIHDKGPQSILGKTDMDFFPIGIAEKFIKDDQLVFETKSPLLHRIELIPRPDFSLDWYETNKYPIFDTKNELIGLVGTACRISESDQPITNNDHINASLKFLRSNYTKKIKIEDIAEASGIEKRTLNRYFRKYFHTTPIDFLKKIRLSAACSLLSRTHQTISEISYETGFSDQSHLTREFRRTHKMTPLQYRRNHQNSSK